MIPFHLLSLRSRVAWFSRVNKIYKDPRRKSPYSVARVSTKEITNFKFQMFSDFWPSKVCQRRYSTTGVEERSKRSSHD